MHVNCSGLTSPYIHPNSYAILVFTVSGLSKQARVSIEIEKQKKRMRKSVKEHLFPIEDEKILTSVNAFKPSYRKGENMSATGHGNSNKADKKVCRRQLFCWEKVGDDLG